MRKSIFYIAITLLATCNLSASLISNKNISLEYKVLPMYGYKKNKLPGRLVSLKIKGENLKGNLLVNVEVEGKTESNQFTIDAKGATEIKFMLPTGIGLKENTNVTVHFEGLGKKDSQNLIIERMRYWNVYLYNHSHVDIGYTNTHKNVELLHINNIKEGIKLANRTSDYPKEARYIWNPEVTWPFERLWYSESKMHNILLNALKKGQVRLDASYVNLNTSICNDEELFHLFQFSRKIQKLSGQPMDVFQQIDIPGISWGIIPVMVQEGIKYIMSWPNTARSGNAHKYKMDGRPFWWVGPDGVSKVLFFQPGIYANSGSMKKGRQSGRPWMGQRDPKKIPLVIKTGYADVDFTGHLRALEKDDYPYDFCVLSWSLWDNCPLDADIPDAIKEWNEKYAYPKIKISHGHEIMSMIEERYGDQLPVRYGDYTEYWTDGLGTAAELTATNRQAKERLLQAETVCSMLSDGNRAARTGLDEAWRYILLASEHTWCFENPSEPFFQEAIWKKKKSYFREAKDRSIELFNEALAPITDKSDAALGPKEGPSQGGVAVINTHSWQRGGIVRLSHTESLQGDRVEDSEGNEVPSQRLSTGELIFMASDVPALGSKHYRIKPGKCSINSEFKIRGTIIENSLLKMRIDSVTGNIIELIDKKRKYNYISRTDSVNANSFTWLPANINQPIPDTLQTVAISEQGPLIVEIEISSKAMGCKNVIRSVRLLAGQPWIEITNTVDKLPLEKKDGIHFGFSFNIPNSKTNVDIPWGIMEVEKDQWKQANRNWLTMQRWLDVSNETHGVTWCSLDAPLFEYGDRYANIAIRGGNKGDWISKLNQSSTIFSWVMNNHWWTNFPLTQKGPVKFRYRLLPHGEYNVVEANRFGMEQAQPLVHVITSKNPDIKPLITVDNQFAYITIIKSVEEDNTLIVRLRSISNKEENVRIQFPYKHPTQINICDLEEREGEEIDGHMIMKPYGQLTLKLKY